MIRSPRRPGQDDPPVITAGMALDWERSGSWPSTGERHRFWNGDGVPSHLTERGQPDPRAVLGDSDDVRGYERELAAWRAARLAWLGARV